MNKWTDYPCMNVDCDKNAVYGISYADDLGTAVCEDHFEKAKTLAEVKQIYKLEELDNE